VSFGGAVQTVPTAMQLRLIYFCKPDALTCCGCLKPLRYAATKGADFDLVTCINGKGGNHCGTRLILLPGRKRTTILRLSRAEAATIEKYMSDPGSENRADDVLKDIGALVETLRGLAKTG
jgi:hypothetical protein